MRDRFGWYIVHGFKGQYMMYRGLLQLFLPCYGRHCRNVAVVIYDP